MKTVYFLIKIALTLALGFKLLGKTYQFKYHNVFFEFEMYLLMILIALAIWAYFVYKDLEIFKKSRQKKYLLNLAIGSSFIIAIINANWVVSANFNKPTLMYVYYDGDYNGIAMDFKKEGTYIFNNYCLGSVYQYGTYEIQGNDITLDKAQLSTVFYSKFLKIMPSQIPDEDTTYRDYYAYQMKANGDTLISDIRFRVVVDNRTEQN